jgi:hypothetical protein
MRPHCGGYSLQMRCQSVKPPVFSAEALRWVRG